MIVKVNLANEFDKRKFLYINKKLMSICDIVKRRTDCTVDESCDITRLVLRNRQQR